MNSVVSPEVAPETSSQDNPFLFAIKVLGEEVTELPKDLYIPPKALKIFLEAFEGPLDLLLYLIKKQNIDILNIPIASITKQYTQYVDMMNELQIDLAAEYLVMAAMLAEIKSRLLLPKPKVDDEEEVGDPRAELIRRLQEYERFKKASDDINNLERNERDTFVVHAEPPEMKIDVPHPEVSLDQVLAAFKDVIKRAKVNAEHRITEEVLSIRERMTIVLDRISETDFVSFTTFFKAQEGRIGVVVTLIAILELLRQKVIEFVQHEPFAPIYVKRKSIEHEEKK
jgi:segregation and condensation protein A